MTHTATPSPRFCTWTPLKDLWTHFEQKEGSLTRVRIAGEHLFLLAAALPDEMQGGWRTSFIIDTAHLGHRGFASQLEAQLDAEQTLTLYLQQQHLIPEKSSPAQFDSPEEHILAQMATVLGDDWHIAHISEYKREWIVVCINTDRTEVEDFAFQYDSDSVLGSRQRLNFSECYDLASLPPPRKRTSAPFPIGGVPDAGSSLIPDATPTIIDWFVSCDDAEHFPIREWVREAIASGKTVDETARWLEAEAQKRSHDVLSNLPWTEIAHHFHEDVGELVAYEQAHGLPTTED